MEVTKENICQKIEDFLKSSKIRYNILAPDSRGLLYELFISSIEGNIQVEYNLDDPNDDIIYVQFFTNIDSNGNSIYHSDWDNESGESIEGEIEELIEAVKRINSGLSKINSKIEQIKDICEEYNLEFEDIIEVLYEFD